MQISFELNLHALEHSTWSAYLRRMGAGAQDGWHGSFASRESESIGSHEQTS